MGSICAANDEIHMKKRKSCAVTSQENSADFNYYKNEESWYKEI